MTTSPTGARVPIRVFLPLLDWLRSEGTDVGQLLRMAGLDRALAESRGSIAACASSTSSACSCTSS
jgi:hypothetical protein